MAADDLANGLQSLGLYEDTDLSIFYVWAAELPAGHFDSHRSILPAPDHLLFHGLTKNLVGAIFFTMREEQRTVAELSIRDGLCAMGLRRTRVYSKKKDKGRVHALSISEWAAVLTLGPAAFARALQRTSDSELQPPLRLSLELLGLLRDVAVAAYFFHRPELDGDVANTASEASPDLAVHVDALLCACRRLCQRGDCGLIAKAIDVPNLHRLREVVAVVQRCLGHVRLFMELALESAHQPMKRAIDRGNGHDDAGRAMRVMLISEFISRLAVHPEKFGIQDSWLRHPGVQRMLASALPLYSQPVGDWAPGRKRVPGAAVSAEVKTAARRFVPARAGLVWYDRVVRGEVVLRVGDAVSVLVTGAPAGTCVNDAARRGRKDSSVAFFRVEAIFTGHRAAPNAIVRRFVSDGTEGSYSLSDDAPLFLNLFPSVRRALCLHNCSASCKGDDSTQRLSHCSTNSWLLLGRRSGYPARSA